MSFRHLLKISELTSDEIFVLAKKTVQVSQEPELLKKYSSRGPVGLIFLEPSTRTRVSFERACQQLSRFSVVVETKGSSFEKGESLEDAVLNLRALGCRTFAIRTPTNNALEELRKIKGISVVNAGDGTFEHPTQALLDYSTLVKQLGQGDPQALRGLRLGICGDLRRSRVARSWAALAEKTGIQLKLISPPEWTPDDWALSPPWTADLKETLHSLDGIMMLRAQKERMPSAGEGYELPDSAAFMLEAKMLGPKQFFMHPGPVNWGVEIHPELKIDPRSLILTQVEMGMWARAVILSNLEN